MVASTENEERRVAADHGQSMQLRIKGNTITRVGLGSNAETLNAEWGRIEVDNTTDTKSLDIISTANPDDRLLGICELKNGVLKICFAAQSSADVAKGQAVERPAAFKSPAGSDFVVLECRRPVAELGLKPLQGVWEVTHSVRDNKPVETNDKAFIEIKGDSFTVLELEDGDKLEPMIRLTAKVDASKTPASIDLFDADGKLFQHGIYQVKDGTLLLCLAETRKTTQRPTTFEPPVGEHARLFELRPVSQNAKDAAE